MTLKDLHATWASTEGVRTHLTFECPKCRKHRIAVPIPPSDKAWHMTGSTLEDVTLNPSIKHLNQDSDPDEVGVTCESHFFIVSGKIEMCE